MMVGQAMEYGNLVLERYDFLMVKKYLQGPLGLEDYAHGTVLALLKENFQKAIVQEKKI